MEYESENRKQVLFWGGGFNCFSSFSSYQIELDGVVYATAEHAYQSAKFEDATAWKKVTDARSAFDAFTLGRTLTEKRKDNWNDIKLLIMEKIVRAKLNQHPHIQEKLIETGNREIIEASPVDSFWGWGPDKNGENHLGKIWMKLRGEIKQ